jgi:hypothetical protein
MESKIALESKVHQGRHVVVGHCHNGVRRRTSSRSNRRCNSNGRSSCQGNKPYLCLHFDSPFFLVSINVGEVVQKINPPKADIDPALDSIDVGGDAVKDPVAVEVALLGGAGNHLGRE